MARHQRRWFCRACQREWAFRTVEPQDTCPGCGTPEAEQIEFQGTFDIHTPRDVIRFASEESPPLAEPTPLTLAQEIKRGPRGAISPPLPVELL